MVVLMLDGVGDIPVVIRSRIVSIDDDIGDSHPAEVFPSLDVPRDVRWDVCVDPQDENQRLI